MLQITRSPQVFDVVVVGSGAGGGTAVKVLTDLGINVALLEAGPMLNSGQGFQGARSPVPGGPSRRRRRTPSCISDASSGATSTRRTATGTLPSEPYTVARGQPVPLVPLAHSRRPHQSLRPHLAALFRLRFPARTTAWAIDWPVTYEEMSPWYDKAEGFIGVTGTQGRPAHRARRQLPAARSAARARIADPEGLREAEHSVHPVAHGDAHEAASTAARPATTAGSAGAAARRRRRSRPARR